MNEERNNGRGIFYGVIGVATLVVAIIGATFAYFTATQTAGNNVIGGNMATISFGVQVQKLVDPGQTSGMIPMSNDMVEAAVNSANNVCVDDNGNAVCQIYKITVTNTSSAAMFVDGYVALAGGSGTPTDYPTYTNATSPTTMRWAQVFPGDGKTVQNQEGTVTDPSTTNGAAIGDYSTAGVQVLGDDSETMTHIGVSGDGTTGKNLTNIISNNSYRGTATISGSTYTTVGKNYIRVSDHAVTTVGESVVPTTSFERTDYTSTLVLSQQLQPTGAADNKNIAEYYIVVWLAETGTSQNPNTTGATGENVDANLATSANNFFNGVVTFNSAQGSEVTATFSGYAAVQSDKKEQ